MTPPAAPDATERQTVGDILLARGYISQPQLEQALASQQQSGKPLGQVLVEAGAITRLELAGALAEQWSDTATWLGPPEEAKSRDGRRRLHGDGGHTLEGREAGYAQQLQDAVVELARRVAAFEPTLTDLKLRVESAEVGGPDKLLDRIEVVQDGVSALARRLDELTDGVERAFGAVEKSTNELAAELEELKELKGRVDVLADTSALETLRGALEQLEARPATDPVLAAQVDTLAERLDEVREAATAPRADVGELDALRAAHGELAERVSRQLEPDALDEVRDTIAELAERVSRQLEADALDEMRDTIAELAARPEPDPKLDERLDELSGRLDALARSVEERADVTALDELRASIAELAARPEADPALADRLEELTGRIEALAGTDALEAVRAAVEEIAGRPEADPELQSRLDGLQGALADLGARVETLAAVESLESVRASVDEIAARPPVAPEIADQLSELSAHVESITAAAATSEEALVDLRAQLAALAASHDAADAASDADPELDRRLDNVVARLDALHARVEEVATAAAPHDVVEEAPKPDLVAVLREELESRIEALASRTDGVAQEAAGAVEALASERDALEARVEALARELADARSQADTQAPAPPAAEPAPPAKEKARDDSEPQGVEAELERLRMAVERINMHLGERERAITDLMRSRSAELTLEELAGRIAELERGGAAAGSTAAPAGDAETSVELRALASRLEEAEQSAKADRDKLLTQLERMASSIDWRFRRIESGESDAAA